jgi:nucleotide-binding universal stress UspA family protein
MPWVLAALDEQHGKLDQQRGWLILDAARARRGAAGVSDVQVHQMHGAVVEIITQMEADADLLVIGRRGASADRARPHLGSNLERVVRASRHPVLVATEEFRPIERVLLAYDGGASSRRAIERYAQSPQAGDLECHILMVGQRGPEADGQMEAAVAMLTSSGYAVSSSIVPGHVEQAIPQEIGRHNADLLVMGAYGHSRIRDLIIGSTTTVMLGVSPVPVLLFR